MVMIQPALSQGKVDAQSSNSTAETTTQQLLNRGISKVIFSGYRITRGHLKHFVQPRGGIGG